MKEKAQFYWIWIAILLVIALAVAYLFTPPSEEPVCGNDILEDGEECESAGNCAVIEGKLQSCVECKCVYEDIPIVPPGEPVCGDGVVEAGEECDPPGSTCANGEACADTCACPIPYDGIECPPDKTTSWTKHCLPGLGGVVKERFSNEDGAGFIGCFPITLAQAHQKGACEDIQTVDPACDDWEGCNAEECYTTVCDYDTIPCVTHYRYVIEEHFGKKFCKPIITYACEAECNCVGDEEATYIECPDEDCESGCPFKSAPSPGISGVA